MKNVKAIARIIAADTKDLFFLALDEYLGTDKEYCDRQVEALAKSAEKRIDFTYIHSVGGSLAEILDDVVILQIYRGAYEGFRNVFDDEEAIDQLTENLL